MNLIPPITIRFSRGFHLVNPMNIMWIETATSFSRRKGDNVSNGDGNFTYVFLANGDFFLVCKQMGYWEKKLKPYKLRFAYGDFCRVHQSHIVNLSFIRSIETTDGFTLLIGTCNDTCKRIPVARAYKPQVRKALGI